MERTLPARALAAVGTAVAVLASATAAAPPTTGSVAAEPGAASADPTHTVVLARRHHHRHRSSPGRTTGRWAGSISVNRRSAVEAAYRRSYAPGLEQETGWTGSDSGCRPGTTSAASRAATLRAVNFVRAMSGLAPVRFSSVLDGRAQRTALMMSANGTLSHAPSRSWRCYSAVGAANAARSNLALSYPSITSAGLVGLYMSEPGSANAAVGHRRWLLNPFATTMGSGSTRTANAITVIGPTRARRPNPAWVSWPTAGYFPAPLEPGGRWSLSAGNRNTDFRRATVHVYRNGHALRTVKQRVHGGYAMPTLVWQIPAGQASSGRFRVVVRGVHRRGTKKAFGRTYDVTMFAPAG